MQESNFIALDVETASQQAGSICQIGIARFCSGQLLDRQEWLVWPETSFSAANTKLHGIDRNAVLGASGWKQIHSSLAPLLLGAEVVSYTMFDRRSIFAACCRASLPMFSYRCWQDAYKLARNAWPLEKSYRLAHLANGRGFAYTPAHRAGDDAVLAGRIYLAARRQLELAAVKAR